MRERIREIKMCLDNKCYHAALCLALTLPDICGDIKYPNTYSSERFPKWFDEYVFPYYEHKNACKSFHDYFEFTGNVCYQLRCRFLHNNDLDIYKPDKNCYIDNFKLCVCPTPGKAIDSIKIKYNPDYMPEPFENLTPENYKKTWAESTLEIDVIRFCNVVCKSVERFCTEYGEYGDNTKLELHEITLEETNTKHLTVSKDKR